MNDDGVKMAPSLRIMKLFRLIQICHSLAAVQSFTPKYNPVERIRRASILHGDGDQKEGKQNTMDHNIVSAPVFIISFNSDYFTAYIFLQLIYASLEAAYLALLLPSLPPKHKVTHPLFCSNLTVT